MAGTELRFEDFAAGRGLWRLTRQIIDRHGSMAGDFMGTARFLRREDGLLYEEQGRLSYGAGPSLQAERRYIWRADGHAIAVFFEDGRPFHRFALEPRAEGSDHPCGEDLYRVAYDFAYWPRWTAVWTVAGPRKDYTSTSVYHRA